MSRCIPVISHHFHSSYGTHLLDHLAANGACLTGGQVAVVAVHQVDAHLNWSCFSGRFNIVLSGMNTMEQIQDNLRDMQPLSREEYTVLGKVREVLNRSIAVPCTGCRYCVSHCPQNIAIPEYVSIYNSYARHPGDDWKIQPIYEKLNQTHSKASACVQCRQCQAHCPQNISIPQWLTKVAGAMEK